MKLAIFPRAAVSVAARYCCEDVPLYVMVQRGNEPNKGLWSLPGGKIKLGESSIHAAQRELREETKLGETSTIPALVKWHAAPFTSTDFIQYEGGDNNGLSDFMMESLEEEPKSPSAVVFHYVISQCFAEVTNSNRTSVDPPALIPCDDAMDAAWWTIMDVKEGVKKGLVSDGCDVVVDRAERLYKSDFFTLK